MTHERFDYVVVGGGSAGCVIAARLAEQVGVTVLLLEAGQKVPPTPLLQCPARFGELINSKHDWRFDGYPRGKMLGGCSNINACVYLRGDPKALDCWPPGWQNEDLAPYFRKAENCSYLPPDILRESQHQRGFDGPIRLSLTGSNGASINENTRRFIDACQEIGAPHVADINNGVSQEGVSYHQFNVHHGVRESVDLRYLQERGNLTIRCEEQIARIDMHGNRAVAAIGASGTRYEATRELVLAAGSIGSPWLLMLSGIGVRRDLEAVGIDCIVDLPVGAHLVDHVMSPFIFASRKTTCLDHESRSEWAKWVNSKTGDFTDSGVQASLFTRSRHAQDMCDVQITFLPGVPEQIANFMTMLFHKHALARLPGPLARLMNMQVLALLPRSVRNLCRNWINRKRMRLPRYGFVLFPVVGLPESTGHIRLRSKDPAVLPEIVYNPFAGPQDREIMIDAVRTIRSIIATDSFRALAVEEVIDRSIPHPPDSDEYILSYTERAASQGHVACTCPMGKVVDEQLRVYGVEGLRIVDASVLPTMVNGNIQSTVLAVAEKAADLLRNAGASA